MIFGSEKALPKSSPAPEKISWELAWLLIPALPLFTLIPLLKEVFDFYTTITGSRALVCLLELVFSFSVFLTLRQQFIAFISSNRLIISAMIAFFLWVIFSSIAVAFADYLYPAILRQAEWYCHLLFSFTLWQAISLHPHIKKYFFWLISLGLTLTTFLFVLKWLAVTDPIHIFGKIPGFQNLRHFGYFIVICFIFSCYYLLINRKKASAMALTTILLIICWTFLFWTGGRGAFISILISSLFIFILFDFIPRKILAISFISSSSIGYLISAAYKVPGQDLLARIIDYSSPERIDIWKQTLEAYSHKIHFGFGPDGYAYLQPLPNYHTVQPHNIIIQFLTDWGLVGGTSALALLAILTYIIFRKIEEEKDLNIKSTRLLGFWGILSFLILSLIDGPLYHSFPVLFLMFSFSIGLERSEGNSPSFTPPAKILLKFVFFVLLFIITLHTFVIISLHSPAPPLPWSFKAKIIRKFPTSLTHLDSWLEQWRSQNLVDETLEWTRWAQKYARRSWKYYIFEARLMQDKNKSKEARILLVKSMAVEPTKTKRYLSRDASLASLWDEPLEKP